MSVTYRLEARPVTTTGKDEEVVQDANGVRYGVVVISRHPFIPTGNTAALIQAAANNTVQPTSAQMVGLNKYLSLIQLGHSTAAAETTLSGLS